MYSRTSRIAFPMWSSSRSNHEIRVCSASWDRAVFDLPPCPKDA